MSNKIIEKISSRLDLLTEACVLLTLFCLPFSKSAVEICVGLSIAALAVKKIFIERSLAPRIGKNVLMGLLLFSVFNILSLANSHYTIALSFNALFSKVFKWALFFIAVAETIKRPEQLKRIFMTMLFSCVLILADAAYQQYITGKDFLHYPHQYPVFKYHGRKSGNTTFPTASFPYPGDFATWIDVYLFTFLSILLFDLKNKRVYRFITASLCVFLAFFLFLTTSAGATVGAFLAAAVLFCINIRRFLFFTVVLLIVGMLALSFIPYFRTYLRDGILNKTLSINDRMSMWSIGWLIFKKHPVIGSGVNTFFEHFKNFRNDEYRCKKGSYAHNCFLQMAADTGVLGVGAFFYLILSILYPNMRRAVRDNATFEGSHILGLGLGMIAFLSHSFFDTNLYSLNLAALFWLSMALIEGSGSQDR